MEELSAFSKTIFERTYSFYPGESWEECARRVAKTVANDQQQEEKFFEIIKNREFIPGGRFLYTAGRPIFQCSNCFALVPHDSREGWAETIYDTTMCLSMGGGVGINYSGIRASGTPVKRMGGTSSGPLALMQIINEVGRHVMSGGARRSALWAGLNWNHPDIERFIAIKDWDSDIKQLKAKNFEQPATLDQTNVSVIIGDRYLDNLARNDPETQKLHTMIVEHMMRTGEPAFRNQSLILKDDPDGICGNPCQETVLHHRDVCLLGSIVLPKIKNLTHLEEVTRLAIQLLYNGSIKGHYPTPEIAKVAKRNRRLGLGFMGLHEFMLLNNHRYEWFPKLEEWLKTWAEVATDEAKVYSRQERMTEPINTRACAPTGTISIIGQTTSGIEPIFCTAYKRRYLNGNKHFYQYVVDPTAKKLINLGIPTKDIEDAYTLADDFERRLNVQAHVQQHVDMAISSTVNLPPYGTKGNNNVETTAQVLTRYLPKLKGITLYPDQARPGQPLTRISIEEASSQHGVVFEELGETCTNGVCGL